MLFLYRGVCQGSGSFRSFRSKPLCRKGWRHYTATTIGLGYYVPGVVVYPHLQLAMRMCEACAIPIGIHIMNFEDEFLARFARVRRLSRSFPLQDFAILCVMAKQPERRFEVQQLADAVETAYTNAWNSMRRLQLAGLVLGGRLNEHGREAMGIDPDWVAPNPLDKAWGGDGPAAPVDAPAPEAVPDPADLF